MKKQRQIPCQKNKEEILKPQTVRKRNLSRSSTAAPKPVKRRIISKTDGVTDHACKLAKSHGLTSLERRSVSRGVESQYAEYYQRYMNFCQEAGLELPPSGKTDDHLAEFMDGLFLEGREVAEGEKTLASLEYHHAVLKGKLTRSRKCLRGWRKERPPQSRIPLPKLVVYGVAMIMKSRNQAEMAVKVLLDFDAYLRPGEGVSLRARSVVAPVKGAGPQYNWHAIIIREFEDGQPDKPGGSIGHENRVQTPHGHENTSPRPFAVSRAKAFGARFSCPIARFSWPFARFSCPIARFFVAKSFFEAKDIFPSQITQSASGLIFRVYLAPQESWGFRQFNSAEYTRSWDQHFRKLPRNGGTKTRLCFHSRPRSTEKSSPRQLRS